nr:adhesion G-protein coupled receptor G7 [Manis javanica]
MASCREWDPKVLVAIVCGLLTTTVLGLGIWRAIIRIQRGTFTVEASVPIEFCRNGGTWENGRCTCPEEWKGLRCTITNFCENSTFEDFTFARIPVGRYGTSLQTCDEITPNAGRPKATRLCNITTYGEIVLEKVTIGNCNENLETLEKQIVNISKESNNISAEAQILTSDANRLTPDNLTSATRVAGQIFNASRYASTEAKRVAVTTVSQLLDASDDVFQRAAAADNTNSFATLVEQMEDYSLSLGNESVVSPNLAVKSVNFSSKDTVGSTDVLFTVTKGSSDSFVSSSISVNINNKVLEPNEQTELQILLSSEGNSQACGFVVYQNNKLFQSKTFKAKSNFTQKIISSSTKKIERAPSTVKMVFSPKYNQQEFQLHSYACVYWNFYKKDWDTYGCQKVSSTDKFLNCSCNHTTNFAVLMSFRKTYKYPESLDIMSNVGCALSITGLALTIVFQIVTRRISRLLCCYVLCRLVEQMEDYSLSLGNESVVSPNLAVKSVNFSSKDTVGSTDVLFTVTKGSSDSFVSSSISVNINNKVLEPNEQTELQILLSSEGNSQACGFVVYQNNKLFQSKTFKAKSNFTQKIISSSTKKIERAPSTVKMVFSPKYNQQEFQLHSYACVYWNFYKKDWDTYGCQKVSSTDKFLNCSCNHTTNFAVLMSFRKTYKYPESLDIMSNVGCALSITGLALTIVFQIVTRKGRKTSVTWVLVSLCMSMLIFNLFFVFGIENSNKNLKTSDTSINDNKNEVPAQDIIVYSNPTCTVIAALMHYFLLATFTWSGLNAAQLYFLLIRTMKPLPQRFTLFISLIGWGVPAVVVALTVGIIYSLNGNDLQWEFEYRQEEICWLAISTSNGFITVPFLWSFLVPVTIILISNVVIFIIITVKVLWKNNQNLTSTKKISSLKKILSTLSIAVVSGITWVLAYLMLIENENVRIIFSYMFCLFNTTQGLQIFILYTVRTKIFQSEASKVLNLLSSSTSRVKSLPSVISMRLSDRMYNLLSSSPTLREYFRLLDPSVVTEETTLSESDQANTSI